MKLTQKSLKKIILSELRRSISEQARDAGDVPGGQAPARGTQAYADSQREIWGVSDEDLERERIQKQADERGISFEEMEAILAHMDSPEYRREQYLRQQEQARAHARDEGNWPEPRTGNMYEIIGDPHSVDIQNGLKWLWLGAVRDSKVLEGVAKQFTPRVPAEGEYLAGFSSPMWALVDHRDENGVYTQLVTQPVGERRRGAEICRITVEYIMKVSGDQVDCEMAWNSDMVRPGSQLARMMDAAVQAVNGSSASFPASLKFFPDGRTEGANAEVPASEDEVPVAILEFTGGEVVALVNMDFGFRVSPYAR